MVRCSKLLPALPMLPELTQVAGVSTDRFKKQTHGQLRNPQLLWAEIEICCLWRPARADGAKDAVKILGILAGPPKKMRKTPAVASSLSRAAGKGRLQIVASCLDVQQDLGCNLAVKPCQKSMAKDAAPRKALVLSRTFLAAQVEASSVTLRVPAALPSRSHGKGYESCICQAVDAALTVAAASIFFESWAAATLCSGWFYFKLGGCGPEAKGVLSLQMIGWRETFKICLVEKSKRQMESEALGTPAALHGKFLSAAGVMCNSDKALVQLWKPVLEATNLAVLQRCNASCKAYLALPGAPCAVMRYAYLLKPCKKANFQREQLTQVTEQWESVQEEKSNHDQVLSRKPRKRGEFMGIRHAESSEDLLVRRKGRLYIMQRSIPPDASGTAAWARFAWLIFLGTGIQLTKVLACGEGKELMKKATSALYNASPVWLQVDYPVDGASAGWHVLKMTGWHESIINLLSRSGRDSQE
ncbi:hypothetical protein AK812_SmicGene7813 [Symbiodinium microadriaticum]|uniref:Uncharacterized protein n=1 Tax=Symbiodinium microadriaticum TaxID=2951 RepID=A0A1Q9EMQ9_SYMMI|nr:hypothetical protein AK812_SmicGene7813 [Symbiodinium microadriaticum]